MTPADYIDSVISYLASVEFIVKTHLIRAFSNNQKGHLRMRVSFTNDTFLEFYEYIEPAPENRITVITYAYHWANPDGSLIQRCDNTPHFPSLENFPHHVHTPESVEPGRVTNILAILAKIDRRIR